MYYLIFFYIFVADKKPPPEWPEEGRVTFNGVFMTYSPNEPPVLKNLNFTIEAKEKVKFDSVFH